MNLPLVLALQIAAPWTGGPPLPVPLANNAVAGVEGSVFTFGGVPVFVASASAAMRR